MSNAKQFGLAQQTALVVQLANSGTTKSDIAKALEAKGLTTKIAQTTLDYISATENIIWRGKGAQGWREVMTAEFKKNPDLKATEFRKILDTQFGSMKQARRIEYTRYYFPMMSELRKMKTS